MCLMSRRCVLRPALVLLAVAAAPGAFAAEALSVMIDHAKVMHISRPAEVVIVGNPGIADATIQDQQTLIITGRSFGSTNLIVLDSSGKAIAEETILVEPSDGDNVVSVYKTVDKHLTRQTFSCTPACSPTLTVGDEDKAFTSIDSQIKSRGDFSKGAAP
jgi:hypothetical protein